MKTTKIIQRRTFIRLTAMSGAALDIEVIVMKNNFAPEGGGEPGLPPIAPALTNAIFNMTGTRIRVLPFNLDKI
jgi:isoquinoline 1-oxidoreductase beta subunit